MVTVLEGRKRITVYRVPVNPLFAKSRWRARNKKYIYTCIPRSAKTWCNFRNILIKHDNSICIEDEDSLEPIEHVSPTRSSSSSKNEKRWTKWSEINVGFFCIIYLFIIYTCLLKYHRCKNIFFLYFHISSSSPSLDRAPSPATKRKITSGER